MDIMKNDFDFEFMTAVLDAFLKEQEMLRKEEEKDSSGKNKEARIQATITIEERYL